VVTRYGSQGEPCDPFDIVLSGSRLRALDRHNLAASRAAASAIKSRGPTLEKRGDGEGGVGGYTGGMFLRVFRQRGAIKKVGKRLFRPLATGVVAFFASLIVWKLLLGALHATGVIGWMPGLRGQYILPLAIGVIACAYRLRRDLGGASSGES
jgi:hypothetical protein